MMVPLTVTTDKELATMHLGILTMFHKISGQELAVMEELVAQFLTLNRKLNDKKQTFNMIFSSAFKKEYRATLKITPQRLQNILYSLRKKGLLKDNTITSSMIPQVKDNESKIHFNITIKE